MDVMNIVMAALAIGLVGLLVGLLLVWVAGKFEVQVDEREAAVRELLPGNNCGGCGYAGCDGLAAAIAQGKAPVGACPVGGSAVAAAISQVMGVEAQKSARMVAFVKCAGTCEKAKVKSKYYGIKDCRSAAIVPGKSEKKCTFGCMGYGTCVKECPFDAIHMIDGVAVVDKAKCKACGKCVAVCPNQLIELVPFQAQYLVACNSTDKGKFTKEACEAGCIGCSKCAKTCEQGAIAVENFLAHVDYGKCINCGKCAEGCPVKIIRRRLAKRS
ncbi:MAG: RnfABCDGE type electron transport complex subunit B [Lachnospiraceae bacterium]|nr:RnfABCDGE type electron transport complex subunit B [Lachnospiraceae bacterium]